MTAILIAEALVKDYSAGRALGPLDLTADGGALVALTGHNGAGKSTLLRLAAGLLEPSSGRLTVCGERPGSLAARRLVSFVPDTPVLYGWRPRAERVIERLGLGDRVDQLPGQLSHGLRQRVALALGLARPFSLLLLDEPFGPLDAAGAEVVAALIGEHVAAGATAIVSSHQLELLTAATHTITLRDGRLVDGRGQIVSVPGSDPPRRRSRRRRAGAR